MLNAHCSLTAKIGWADEAQIYFVVQLCSDRMLNRLRVAKTRHAKVVYIVCDRHFADDTSYAGVNPKWRFAELAELADVLLVPTSRMQRIIEGIESTKRVIVIPDWSDYREFRNPAPVPPSLTAAWFGNPGKGNFLAAEPYLRWLLKRGFRLNLITQVEALSDHDLYKHYVFEWEYISFIEQLRQSAISIIAFAPNELQKSENRLVTSVMNGVPAIVSGASSSADALNENGLSYAVVNGLEDFAFAVQELQILENRYAYIMKMQSYFEAKHGDEALVGLYMQLIQDLSGD